MKKCKNCGMPVEDTHRYCLECGCELNEENDVNSHLEFDSNKKNSYKWNSVNWGKMTLIAVVLYVTVFLLAIISTNCETYENNKKAKQVETGTVEKEDEKSGKGVAVKRPEIKVSSSWCDIVELEPEVESGGVYCYNYQRIYDGKYMRTLKLIFI